jgi:sterol desaturase/sphingolipid hydroxylase (fatty acid hydroxylase superfamily)
MSLALFFSSSVLPVLLILGVLLAGGEALWAWHAGRRTYHRRQLLSDLSCAVLRLPAELFVKLAFVALYCRVQQLLELRVLALESVWTWLIAFVAFELVFYWTHRLSHRVPLLWAVHAVHHQSNDFNLVAGTRLGLLAPTLNYPFFLSLALIGVPVDAFLVMLYISGSWQFLLHTQCWSGSAFLRWFVNTPVHHRAHHSTDPLLGNANFASIFIGFDWLFGSLRAAEGTHSFGLEPAVHPQGPLAANLSPWSDVWRAIEPLPGTGNRLLALVGIGVRHTARRQRSQRVWGR